MKTMLLACGLALALAACGQTPTIPVAPEVAPRMDGGMTLGGGLNTTAPTCEEDTRGGMTLGGGLYTPQPCPEELP